MIEKGIIVLFILPFVVAALVLDEAALLQLINQGGSKAKSLSQNKPQSKTASEESYQALTHQLTGLNDELMSWLYDDKVDELIYHLQALENLTRNHSSNFLFDLNSDSETEEDLEKKPRSVVKTVPNCGYGKICLEVHTKEVDEKPKALKAIVSNKNSVSSDSDEELIYTGDSDSSSEESIEDFNKESSTTIATTTTENAPQGENHNDLDEWIPYSFLNELIKANVTVQPERNLLINKKFARVGKLIFEDSLPKVKESNEYEVKDIKQLIITNSAQGEPTGIIVAENRKFSLDYIDLDDLRAHNDNITSDEKQTQLKLDKVLNGNATNVFREYRKSSKKKVKKEKKPTHSSHSINDSSNADHHIVLRTIAQKRKAQKAAAKQRQNGKNKKKKDWSNSSDKSTDSDDRTPARQKQSESESTERNAYTPKRFQIAKSKHAKTKLKKTVKTKQTAASLAVFSAEDRSTQTLEALSEEVPKKTPPKKLKSKARIPGKPEYYIQNMDRMYKEGQDFRRMRMQQFMPKRYHWDPSEFSHLGYLWFNGHQGKNPPGNFKIAY